MAINDAVTGIPASAIQNRMKRLAAIKEARAYIIDFTPDFAHVCALAGVDPEATHDRLVKMIADAPSPEELLDAGNPRILKFTALGRTATFAEWSKISGIPGEVLRHRAADPRWTPERVVTEAYKARVFYQKAA
ncbi:hypothetical protein [Cereibacter changlensis]|uniref:hypothetical protein n=1 Tax=Cereibacter changlensis TaxID=402884 RepID=UPI0040342785